MRYIRTILYLIIFAFLLLSACGSEADFEIPEEIASLENLTVYSADSEPGFEIVLNKETVFGDTDEVMLGGWLSAHVDDLGRVYIADNQETMIHLYNPEGTYIRQVGREGEGPGEYRNISRMRTDSDHFYLMDRNLNRITTYDIQTFEVLDDVSIATDQDNTDGHFRYPSSFYVKDDGNFIIELGMAFSQANPEADDDARKVEYKIMEASTGEFLSDNIYSFPASEALVSRQGRGMMVMSVPYKRGSRMQYQKGQMVYGWTDQMLLKFYDERGSYQRSVYYSFENVPLQKNQVLDMYADTNEQMQQMVRDDIMPDTWPMFHILKLDDEGRIWIGKYSDDPDTYDYLVLTNGGELLATFTWPRNKNISQIRDGYLYALEENDTGLHEVVKYSITMEG